MIKKLLQISLAASALVAGSAQANFVDFCVNANFNNAFENNPATGCPGAAPDAVGKTGFTADLLQGGYVERVIATPGGTFSALIVASWATFRKDDGTNPIVGGVSGIGTLTPGSYQLYAVVEASGTYAGGVFTPTSGNIKLYQDFDINGTFSGYVTNVGMSSILIGDNGTPVNPFDDVLSFNSGNDTLLLTASFASGSGVINTNTRQFEVLFNNVGLTAAGSDYFIAPRPFVFSVFSDGDITQGTQVILNPGQFEVSGDLSATFTERAIPEPGALGLAGLALVAGAAASRRRKSA